MAKAVSQGLMLASQMKQLLLDFLSRLKFSSSAVTKKTMRMLNNAACQVKVHFWTDFRIDSFNGIVESFRCV